MPTALIKKINLDLLYLPFTESLLDVIALAKEQGVHYFANLGTRTIAEQDALFAQGRTKPGNKVTNAPGGRSMHNYGLACDLVRDADLLLVGLQPDWSAAGYDVLADCAAEVSKRPNRLPVVAGLVNAKGKRWDFGHVQIDVKKVFGRPERDLIVRTLLPAIREGGLPRVFKAVDTFFVRK